MTDPTQAHLDGLYNIYEANAEAAFPGQPFFVPMLPQPELPQDLRDAIAACVREQHDLLMMRDLLAGGVAVLGTDGERVDLVDFYNTDPRTQPITGIEP